MVVEVVARVLCFAVGVGIVTWIVRSAIWTVVVPRPEQVWLTRFLFLVVHSLFYSGFFEDPVTWGILAVAAAAVGVRSARAPEAAAASRPADSPASVGPATAPS